MSQQIIRELKELWSRVETAQSEWHAYIESLRHEVSQEDTSTAFDESSIAAKFDKIESMIAPLELRLQVLIDLKATDTYTLGTAAQVIRQHLPNHAMGPETANSMLMRALNEAEGFLINVQNEMMENEHFITDRFDSLRKNYGECLEPSTCWFRAYQRNITAPQRENDGGRISGVSARIIGG